MIRRRWLVIAVVAFIGSASCLAATHFDRSASLTSPFFVERQTAERSGFGEGETGRIAAERALRDPSDYRLRAEAALALGRHLDPETIGTLVNALGAERSPSVRRAIARAIAMLGTEGITAVKAARDRGAVDTDAAATFAREKVSSCLESVALTVTGFNGEVKGFFRDPFRELVPLGGDARDPLFEVVFGSGYSALAKTLAVRAFGDLRDADAASRLFDAYNEPDFPFGNRLELRILNPARLADTLDQEEELRKAIAFTLYRLGEERPFRDLESKQKNTIDRRLDDIAMLERIYGSLWDRADQATDKGILHYLEMLNQAEWELAYSYNQVHMFDDAIRQYGIVVKNLERLNRGKDVSTGLLNLTHYNLACIHAQRNDVESALRELEMAIDSGFRDYGWIDKDRDLDSVRSDPRFARILAKGR
ncbi:MAG: HEAT repeat domain-containing protein [Planctomycetes bacterium]|nr:HEAT repeat domain-containing protein [Planctomycetota bacterium]